MATAEDHIIGDNEEEIIDFEELRKWKVADLRAKLTESGLSNKGTKQELVARLEEFYTAQDDSIADDDLLDDEDREDDDVQDPEGEEEEDVQGGEDQEVEEGETEGDGAEEKEGAEVNKNSEGNASAPTADTKISIIEIKSLAPVERMAIRAQKFGVVVDETKKLARLERFGPSTDLPGTKRAKVDEETMGRLKKRADRFGETVSSAILQEGDVEKLKKRQDRFGVVTDSDKKSKRAERFGLVS